MPAYPNAIKTFVPKRDLLDDVEASHINDIQDEIASIETTLGTNPTQDSTLINTPAGSTKPVNQWGSVGERLNYMQRRQDTPVFNLYRGPAINSKTSAVVVPSFPAPLVDTHGLYNGTTGVKFKRPGYYHITAACLINPTVLKGTRELALMKNGAFMALQSCPMLTGTLPASNCWLNVSWTGQALAGESLSLQVSIQTWGLPAGVFTSQYFSLSGFLIRDL